MKLSADQHFQSAAALHEKGQLSEAEREYRLALGAAPAHFDALMNLALLYSQQGRLDEAETLLRQAIDANAASPDARNHLGALLQARSRHVEALAYHRDAIDLDPEFCEAHYDLATALLILKRAEEAAAAFRSALTIDPEWPEAHFNLAISLQALDRRDEAIASYEQAIALKPDYVRAHTNLGGVLFALGRTEDALASFDRALALTPDNAEALNDRGTLLRDLGRWEEALASYDRALRVKPDYAEAFYNRGNALFDLKRIDDALASYDRALAIKPDYAEALNNRGAALRNLSRHDEAADTFERLVTLRPDFDYARGHVLSSRLQCCDWENYDRSVELIRNDVAAGKRAATAFIFVSISGSPTDQLQCARTFAESEYPLRSPSLWTGERYGHERVRVAYLSADFRNHPVAHLTAGLFEAHDRRHFETTALSFGPGSGDEIRARLENSFGRFIDARRMSDRDAARVLRELEIDIAVDLNGYTQDCRPGILALRPAPVQASFLGYPGTMGAGFVDYILADRTVIPDEEQRFYAEKVASLPDTFMPSDDKRRIARRTPSRADAGLPETGFVFCAFTNAYKIVPPMFEVWMRLLRRVEGSVLWLRQDHAAAMGNLRREAERRGVDPGRLVFAPRVERMEDHLARQRLAGFLLDTLPYNAHATASDALWAGLPVVTCLGTAFAGRVAASLLRAVGLPELIAGTLDDYEALALELARDEALLVSIKEKLARHRDTAPLFDTARFCRHIETAYDTMAQRSQRGEPPESFKVA